MRWRPFLLNPGAPAEGVDKLTMYNEKFGAARVASMVPMMTQRFAEVGLKYSLGGRTGSTLNSHRLAAHALKSGGEDMQGRFMEEMMVSYFSEEKFVNDRSVLLAAAEKAQVPGAAAVLDDPNALLAEVKAELKAFGRGVSGVPHFIVDGRFPLGGAQPAEVFDEIFEGIASE